MRAADHAVLMIAEQRLDVLRRIRDLLRACRSGGVAQLLGAHANSVQSLVAVFDLGFLGSLDSLTHPSVARLDGRLRRALLATVQRRRLRGDQALERVQ